MVDDQDYEAVSRKHWYKFRVRDKIYAKEVSADHCLLLHRFLLSPGRRHQVDHRNGDGLDNQRHNIRIATHAQNQRNREIKKNNSSGFNGVSWQRNMGKWSARIYKNGVHYRIGFFTNKEDAVQARLKAERRLFGEFAPSTSRA